MHIVVQGVTLCEVWREVRMSWSQGYGLPPWKQAFPFQGKYQPKAPARKNSDMNKKLTESRPFLPYAMCTTDMLGAAFPSR